MKREVSNALTFLAGAALATGITLLFTTNKGEELRNKVANWLKEKGIKLKETELDELMGHIWSRGKAKTASVMPEEPSMSK